MSRRVDSPQLSASSILYIGLIPFEWSEQNLQAVVSGTAKVLDVRLGFDHVGKNKGFAFVEFENPQEAQKAANLISQIRINFPDGRPSKRLRIELSKEGFRTGNSPNKQVLPFISSNLPPYVELPPGVQGRGGGPQLPAPPRLPPVPGMPQRPPIPQLASQSSTGPRLPSVPGSNGGDSTPAPAPAPTMNHTNGGFLPESLLRASSVLTTPSKIPLETPDSINETLSLIPPAQLIELIANLKNLLSMNNAARAAEVFQLSPNLAAAAAQALLLMGFVDEAVIQETMKSASSTPQPQQPAPSYQQAPPNYQQQQQQQPYQQNYQNNYNQQPQGYSSYNQPPGLALLPPPPPRPQQYQQQPPRPPQQQQQQQPGSEWSHLPLSTQMKLGALPPEEATVIARVLSLPQDQINALAPDQQSMVASIKQQYL